MSKLNFNEIKKRTIANSNFTENTDRVEPSREDPFDKLLTRLSNDNDKYSCVSGILTEAEKEYLYFKANASLLDDPLSLGSFDFNTRCDRLFATRRFAFENTYKDTDLENNKIYIFVKPNTFQRSYCLLLCIQELLEEEEKDIEVFMILHRLERHGKPHVSLRSQYDRLISGIHLLNDLYPNHHISYHKVKWFDEDPGKDADLRWDEAAIMKNYDLPDDRPMVTGIDVAGIFMKHDQDKAYKSSLYSDIGWREEQDGYLHKDNYMVDIETGQRWKWSRNQSIEWTDLTIEYPTLLD